MALRGFKFIIIVILCQASLLQSQNYNCTFSQSYTDELEVNMTTNAYYNKDFGRKIQLQVTGFGWVFIGGKNFADYSDTTVSTIYT